MKNYKSLVIASVFGGLSCAAAAQPVGSVGAAYESAWGISGEFLSIDADMAAANGIADSGFGLGVSYSGEKGLFNFTAGASFFFIDDEDEFSQRVEDWSGDESTEESSIDAGSLYIDAGVLYPVSEAFSLGLNGGYRYFDIDRGITNCRDCYSESVGVESDTYVKPFARFGFNDSWSGTLAYFAYSGDKGAENSLQFEVNASF